jgi:FtsH-binding integral membrane protein
MFFLFFINRQISFFMARLITKKRENANGDLIRFHAPKKTIWVFSLCLLVIVTCGVFSLNYAGIAAWNVLIICAILFLAQGGGIVLHYLTRRPMSIFMRLLCVILFVFFVFSPGINMAVIAALVLLGIAENWLPLRVSKEQ